MFAMAGDEEPSAVAEADDSDADILEMPDDSPKDERKKKKVSVESLSAIHEQPNGEKEDETEGKELKEPSISDEVIEWPPEPLSSWLARFVIDDNETAKKPGEEDEDDEDYDENQ